MPLNRTAVINVVGLTPALLGPATPRIAAFAQRGSTAGIQGMVPAVTCSVQATYSRVNIQPNTASSATVGISQINVKSVSGTNRTS